MEVGPRLWPSEGVPQVGALLGGLPLPIMLCSRSPRPPHGSGHQIRDALQPFPVYVVLLRLFLPFPVFKVSFCPSWGVPELAQAGLCQGLTASPLDTPWSLASPGGGRSCRQGRRCLGSMWMGPGLLGGLGSGLWTEAI